MNNALRPLFVPAILVASIAGAQITIGPADMLTAGDTVRYRTTLTTDADLSDTGPAHVWDFGTLDPMQEGADTAVAVDGTPILYQFYFNNALIYPEHVADFALRGQSFDLQAISIQDVYEYYKSDADGFRDVGFGARINGLPASVQRNPVDWIYHFPLNYQDQDDGSSEYHIDVPTFGYFGQQQMRHNEVDGWGTLYLPADTFQVLRVVSTLERTDTIYSDQFGIGFALPEPETIEYKWLAQGMKEPVLQITTTGGMPSQIRFYYDLDDIPTGVAASASMPAMHLWPDPANDVLHIDGNVPAGTWEIIDAQGRVMQRFTLGADADDRVRSVRALSPGGYTLRRADGQGAQRFLISR